MAGGKVANVKYNLSLSLVPTHPGSRSDKYVQKREQKDASVNHQRADYSHPRKIAKPDKGWRDDKRPEQVVLADRNEITGRIRLVLFLRLSDLPLGILLKSSGLSE
jgi:hypothetical protein